MTSKSLFYGTCCELKEARALIRTSDNSIESAETETGTKLAKRINADCEMRVVIIVRPLTQTSLLEPPAKPLLSLNYGIEPHRSKLPLECPQFEEAPTLAGESLSTTTECEPAL